MMTELVTESKHLLLDHSVPFPIACSKHSLQMHKGPITEFAQARRFLPLEVISLGQPSFLGKHVACVGQSETKESQSETSEERPFFQTDSTLIIKY